MELYKIYKAIGAIFSTLIGLCEPTEERYIEKSTLRVYVEDWVRVAFVCAIIGYFFPIGAYELCYWVCIVFGQFYWVIMFHLRAIDEPRLTIDDLCELVIEEV